ncbi:MAG TPA: glycoside hydrolase family 3 N-terminal domain-containing protein [Blastocatellia bacterium]|nr:glycoside hydrolase family 3 N-terminal domain-containing protein [Blastocatellia bacterium]
MSQTFRSLTLDEKIGQMFMVDANITGMNRDSDQSRKLENQIINTKVGGVILFRSQVSPTAVSANRWQSIAKVPLFISADLEMGMGMRFDDAPWWPPNMAVAATWDAEWARLQGRATATQARAVGVNWVYAPVIDVNNNPDNPVINTRSYGEDPHSVAIFGRAFIEGVQEAGALACAKHFPGHGDTATDSHLGLPFIDVSRERLNNLELVPFREAILAGTGSIMLAHVALPQIDPELAAPMRAPTGKDPNPTVVLAKAETKAEADAPRLTLPVTLSPKVTTGLLREELKYDGIIVTDALSMSGITARYAPAEAAVRAVKAGSDILLKSPDLDAAIAGIKSAIKNGQLTEGRIDASVEKILRAKAALGLHLRRKVDLNELEPTLTNPEFSAISQEIAEHSITLVKDDRKVLPLKFEPKPGRQGRVFNITFTDEEDRAITKVFVDELRSRVDRLDHQVLDQSAGETDLASLMLKVDSNNYDAVIYSVAVRTRSGKGSVALPRVGRRISEELAKRNLPLVVISFGNPYLLTAMPNSPSYLLAYSPFPVSQRAAAKAVMGEIEISGRLPVTLSPLYRRGAGLHVERRMK